MRAVLTSLLAFALACNSSKPAGPPPPASRLAAPAPKADAGPPPENKGVEYTENDFVESDHNRDPFRSFLVQSQPATRQVSNQRKIQLVDYSLDELKLVAIVMASDQPRAMFVDPTGKGTVVYKGNFICRPEVVHLGGSSGPEYQLNWRIDRIRPGDVVLIREDPAQPAIPPATRVVPLHPENEKQAEAVR
jgi:type IV pilus assembly protein PilP